MKLDFSVLKDRQGAVSDSFSDSLGLRVHRALSWLKRAECEKEDHDARFIFLWIAFNAAYAADVHDRKRFSGRGAFSDFVDQLVKMDSRSLLYNTVWESCSGAINDLLSNKYIFQPFWDHQNGNISASQWQYEFDRSNAEVKRALQSGDTQKVIMVVLERLHTLRNQLVDGGATWQSQLNREQVRDGADLMSKLVPAVLHIMMDSSEVAWGEPSYPHVEFSMA
jgi:hypothetical protein